MPYILDGQTFKVQFANIAAVGAVPSTRVIASGTGLAGGGDLSADRVISIAAGGVGVNQLSLTGVTAGTYGSGSDVPVLTVDATGRVTSVTTAALSVTGFVPTSRTITAGNGLTGGGSLASDITLSANFSATTPLALGSATAGVAITLSRGDHVHPALDLSDTNQTQGALPLGRGGTGDALSPVAGAVVYSTGTKFAVSTAGAPGQILVSNGTTAPSWTNVGAGTVTSVAVATANGLAGTVANPTVSPVITLSTTVTGVVKGDGTTLSAATAGTDYVAPGAYTASGLTMATARLLGRTTASIGAAQELTVGTGLTLASGSLVNAAPDQVVSLTGAGTTTITGTYPSFTITSNDSTAGTVTSVNASGGTTGMSFTGGPITSAGTLTLNGTLAVANGGTGAIDAPTALTNLGAYPASNPSGFTSNVGTVTSVSGTGTVSGLSLSGTVTSTGSLTLGGTLAVLPSNFASQTANTVLAAPNGSAGTPTFRAIVAADIPTLNQNTTGTASNVTGIVAVANGGTGASVAGTARTNLLAAGSGANTDITSIALTTGTVSTTPTSGTDIVNKAYADSIASGINFHQSVRLATAAALPANTYNNGASGVGATLTGNANGALTVDGVAAVVGNRILVKDEVTQANNGVYTVTQVGSGAAVYILTRATDFDSAGSGVDQIDAGDFFLVTAGTTQSNTSWVQQTPLPIVVGTTAIVFTQFAAPVLYSAGTGLTLAGTVFSITNTGVSASTYGSASSVPVIAINAQGQVTSASNSSISIAGSQITSGTVAIANGGTGATSAPTALTNLGAYPASNPSGFTSNTGTVTSVNLTAGTGVSVSGGPVTTSGSITVTNTAPDQVVALTGAGATTVTGTYPNFTISSPASGAGTVTSIDVSGGTTGLTTSGGPVTTSGTITLAGTLNVANGGTGATTLSSGYLLKGNGTSAVSASVVYDTGTNVFIGGTTGGGKFNVKEGSTNFEVNTSGVSADLLAYDRGASAYKLLKFRGSEFTFNPGDVEKVRIDTVGNLGLNTTTPSEKIEAFGADASIIVHYSGQSRGGIAALSGARIALTTTTSGDDLVFGYAGSPITSGGFVPRMTIDNGTGSITGSTDFRAPIFYDSDNTAYYTDPASTSVVNTVQYGINYTSGGGGGRIIPSTGSPYSLRQEFGSDNSGWRYGIAKNVSGTVTIQFYVEDSGTVAATGDFRAPIFYDSNNTAYYVDPASTSNLVGLTVANTITGNAATATNLSTVRTNWSTNGTITAVVGQLAWKNYGNNHTIFDASQSTSPDGGAVNNTNAAVAWAGTYPTLMGWNGATTYGVRVDSARVADSASAVDFNNLTNKTGGTGTYTTSGDFRAPIFYDSNNTAYYVDGGGVSSLYQINTGIGINLTGGLALNGSGATLANSIGARLGENYGPLWNCDNSATWHHQVINGSMLCGFLASGTNWGSGKVVANSDMRATLFYDYSNTAYYIDPNAGSNVLGDFRVNQNGAAGIQLLSTTGTQSLWIRTGYDGAPTPSVSATNVQFQSSGSSGGSFTFYSGNTLALTVTGDYAQGGGSLRAPLFYDSDNTAFFVDPNSTSVLSVVRANTLQFSSGNQAADLNNASYFILRDPTANPAIYLGGADPANYYDNTTHWFRTRAGGNMAIINSSGLQAPIFYDLANTGYYGDFAGTSNIFNLTISGTGNKYLVIQSTDSGEAMVRYLGATGPSWYVGKRTTSQVVDTASFHFYSESAGATVAGIDVSGNMLASGSMRAPIFYDTNNTAYYWNFADAAGSFISTIITGFAYFQSNRDTSSNSAPLQAYSTGGLGATMAFHRAGYYAVNMGLDADNIFRIGGWSASNGLIQLDMSGNFTALTSSRAPIFYDSDNTGFYINPNSTSAVSGAILIGPNTSGKYTRFGGNGGATDVATVSASNGNLHLDAEAGFNIYLAWYNTSTVNVGGAIVANGNITAFSDIRVKDNVETIPSALDKLDQIRGVTYTRTDLEDKERRYAGVIAQEIEQVLPEAVFENEEYKSVDYNATIALLIQAVKELTNKVKALEAKEQ